MSISNFPASTTPLFKWNTPELSEIVPKCFEVGFSPSHLISEAAVSTLYSTAASVASAGVSTATSVSFSAFLQENVAAAKKANNVIFKVVDFIVYFKYLLQRKSNIN